MKLGDRVRVVSGTYLGKVGVIVGTDGPRLAVQITGGDLVVFRTKDFLIKVSPVRCAQTTTPTQYRGRARYRFARRTLRCVLKEGHAGPCAFELTAQKDPHGAGPSLRTSRATPDSQERLALTRTPEQIAAADARYREHMRRKRGH